MSVTRGKQNQLAQTMKKLQIGEQDLVEKFVLNPRKGGQKAQKTHNCVYLKHRPSGVFVKCSKDRQRAVNRYLARVWLCEKIKERLQLELSKKQQAIAKIRRQKECRRRKTRKKRQRVF